jgi:small Trp-rich protein
MYFLLIGLTALVMKYLGFDPVAAMPWWVVLSPFGLAVVWWAWADSSGYTKRKEMDKMDKRKQDRIEKQRKQMGMLPTKRKK